MRGLKKTATGPEALESQIAGGVSADGNNTGFRVRNLSYCDAGQSAACALLIANVMGRLFDRLMAGSAEYTVEPTGEGGLVLIRNDEHAEAFARLVRELINYPNDEFAVLPTGDGRAGYERVVILPL